VSHPPAKPPESTKGPTRRQVIAGAAGLAIAGMPINAPAIITRDARRPRLDQGIACGDLSMDGAVIWGRCDRPARMHVDWATKKDFRDVRRIAGPAALSASDFTSKLSLIELPPGNEIHYRVRYEDLVTGVFSQPEVGRFRVPDARAARPFRFTWSGDVCGQGFGINPRAGGMRLFKAMRAAKPDLFVHCGDVIYADAPIRPKKRLDDGRTWHNLTIPEKSKVAETLPEFRANFRYNFLDHHLREFQRDVPMAYTWDDHETKNNWWPGRVLADRRYRVKHCDLLSARARQAFFEYTPVARRPEAPGRIYRKLGLGPLIDVFILDTRSHRGPNTRNRQEQPGPSTAFFGDEQLQWLSKELQSSRAIWKVIATPQPLCLQIAHARTDYEGLSNGAPGRPRGREHELARLLATLKKNKVRNVVWVTADVHYAAAHHYHPDRAGFRDFDPFWEFLAGPINAGTFGPNPHDMTFGPSVEFLGIPRSLRPGRSPLDGFQFYGMGEVDPSTNALTVSLHDLDGKTLWTKSLPPHFNR
jgi:alkaline phosphatase D